MNRSELEVLRRVDFEWTTRLASVWEDSAWDVPNLHDEIRRRFVGKLEGIMESADGKSPLGWVINGSGGTGKTHLLGAFRREAVRLKAAFVLVDMTKSATSWCSIATSQKQSFATGSRRRTGASDSNRNTRRGHSFLRRSRN